MAGESCPRAGREGGRSSGDGKAEGVQMNLGFQVAAVKKPLIAVKRIVEKGSYVSFGPKEEDNFIQNRETGDKMMLKSNGT